MFEPASFQSVSFHLVVAPQASKASNSRPRGEGLADRALAAFVIVQAMLKRSRRLQQFCRLDKLNDRMPGYTVRRLPHPQNLDPAARSRSPSDAP